ncbi:uncharacterized protein LOC108904653 [Anoplophora glabripennis]|uniref:uncharacterized protein LOC108904653 n=1 Tax=Anoplophora glabripennis TaxID=217634 RepID=UPI0008754C9F|nr:uncharacterized protein LOC108904653 [Anoplophora glabripennis]
MGSPLSPVLVNIYMEAFEKKALESTTLKPKCWYRQVSECGVPPPPPSPKTGDHKYLDSSSADHQRAKTLGRRTRTPTHGLEREWLHGEKYRTSYQEETYTHRETGVLSDDVSTLHESIQHYKEGGGSVSKDLQQRPAPGPRCVQYSLLLRKGLHRKATGRHINTRLKEHKSHLKNNNWEKSAVAEHRADTGHTLNLSEVNMVVRGRRFWPRLYREALEIYRNPNNFNKDGGVDLRGIWKRVIRESNPQKRQQRGRGHPPERHGSVTTSNINSDKTSRSPVSE